MGLGGIYKEIRRQNWNECGIERTGQNNETVMSHYFVSIMRQKGADERVEVKLGCEI